MFVSFSWPWSPSAPSGPPSELPRDGASLRALSRGCRSASCSAVRAPLTHVWEGWSATRAYCQGHGGSSSGCAMQSRWKARPRAASQRASGVPIRVGFQSGALEGPTCTQTPPHGANRKARPGRGASETSSLRFKHVQKDLCGMHANTLSRNIARAKTIQSLWVAHPPYSRSSLVTVTLLSTDYPIKPGQQTPSSYPEILHDRSISQPFTPHSIR
jgi:hypothetical protein